MPNPSHFSWGSCSHGMHLALPRPSSSAAAGTYVQLTAEAARSASTLEGPLAPGDVGYVLEDTGSGDRPFLVQELVSGRLWWYPEGALCSISSESVAPELRSPPAPGEGCYVTLMHDYRSYSDAGRGPLSLFMRDEDAYGIVLMESGQRFRVRSCFTGKDWWFDNGAVRPVQMRYVPEALRARVRPRWGDYVALTHDHGEFGSAAEGPLEPGNLGVVVAITSDLPDAAGGLQVPRYLVRACHNGQCYRYQEGALHLVVPQLLHAPKISPATGRHRRRKLAVKLQLLEPGAAAAACAADAGGGASDAAAGRAALPSGHIVTWPDGALQPVQRVVPGRTYLIAAKLSCKDDDLMLANLRVRSFDLYAPSGTPGHFTHLPPVDTISSQQQQQGQQPGRCQPLVSLAVCNSGRADSGNSSTQQPRGAGTRAWYNPVDDQVLSWFLWDSSDTPLVLKPNKVTGVEFVWGVSFAGLEGQETKQHMLFLQTAEQAPPGAEAGQQQQQLSSTYASFVSLPAATAAAQGSGLPDIAFSASSANSFVLPWLAGNASGRRGRRAAADSSSSSSDGDNDDADEEEEGDGGGSDEDAGSSELESEGHNDGENDEEEQQQEEEEDANEAAALSSRRDSNDGGGAGGFGDGGRSSSGSNADGRPPAAGDGSRGGSDGGAAGSAPPTPPAGASAAGAGVEAASAAGGGAQGAVGDSAAAAAPCDSAEGIDAGVPCNTAAAAAGRSGGSSRPAGVASSSSFHAGDDTGSSSDRLPSTPDLGSTASAASSSSRPGSSPAVAPGSSSSSGGGTRDAFHRSRQDQSAAHSGSSGGGGGSARGPAAAAAAAAQPRRGIRSAAGVSGAACSSLVGGVSIAEVMRQMQLQAESRQPLWQEGTELAASLAAKAMAAAEEWQSHWPRPR